MLKKHVLKILSGLLVILFLASLLLGDGAITLWQIAGNYSPEMTWLILSEIRLPRTLLSIVIGFVLGMSGAVLQGYLRNPLAEPTILGISSTASVGAVIALYFGLSANFAMATPLMGMLCAMLGLAIMMLIAGRSSSILLLILAGVAVSSLSGAMLALALNFAPSPYAGLEIVFWMMGSVSDRDWTHIVLILPFVITGCFLLWKTKSSLDALTFGEAVAVSMGVQMNRLRWLIVAGVGLSVGACVSVAGSIGFIGLIVPHIVRVMLGEVPGRLILPSALLGAALLLFADIVVRLMPTSNELKLGVLTSILGTPFFFYILFKHRKFLH